MVLSGKIGGGKTPFHLNDHLMTSDHYQFIIIIAHKTYILHGCFLKELEIFSVFMCILTVVFVLACFVCFLFFYFPVRRPCYAFVSFTAP